MAFRRPPSAFRNQLGSPEFPFESGRYVLYVALACPWANGALQVARLKGLTGPLPSANAQGADGAPRAKAPMLAEPKMQVAVVHPTWQYTDPETDMKAGPRVSGFAAGVGAGEPHAGWVFAEPGSSKVPLAVMRNCSFANLELRGTPEEICAGKVPLTGKEKGENGATTELSEAEVLKRFGVPSPHCTLDPSKHKCPTLRHLYEKAGGFMSEGVRATTPMIFDTKTDRVVSNESMDIAKFLNQWGEQEAPGRSGPDIYPEALRAEIDKMIDFVYPINNGVYRCGFASSQEAYDQAAVELEKRMFEVDKHLSTRKFLVGEQLTIADIRLYNTLIRMDEAYVAYFKTYFASLFAPFQAKAGDVKFPALLRFTARMYNDFPEMCENTFMDEIRKHYFTSHAIRNAFAVVPKEVGVVQQLAKMKE